MIPNVRKKEDFQYSLIQNMNFYFQNKVYSKISGNYYNVYSLIGKDDPDRIRFETLFDEMEKNNDYNP